MRLFSAANTDAVEARNEIGNVSDIAGTAFAGIEGDQGALDWLERNGLHILKDMALAGDGEKEALDRLIGAGHRELAMAAIRMHTVKTGIDDDHGDLHKYPRY